MDQITALVIIAERRAKALAEIPFHNQADADHRSVCWSCLWDWTQSK